MVELDFLKNTIRHLYHVLIIERYMSMETKPKIYQSIQGQYNPRNPDLFQTGHKVRFSEKNPVFVESGCGCYTVYVNCDGSIILHQ